MIENSNITKNIFLYKLLKEKRVNELKTKIL